MELFARVKTYLVDLDVTKTLILLLVLKAIALDVSFSSSALLIPILGFEGYKLFLKSKAPDPVRINDALQQRLDRIESKVSAVTLEKSTAPITKKWHG